MTVAPVNSVQQSFYCILKTPDCVGGSEKALAVGMKIKLLLI